MSTAIFAAEALHAVDLLSPTTNIAQFDVGVYYLGGPKNLLRRTFLTFDVFGPTMSGRPLTPADAPTSAELLTLTDGLFGAVGWPATLARIDRAGYDPLKATWNTYNGVNAWTAGGGDFNTPTLSITSPTIALTDFTIDNILPFVTDAIASRAGKVRIAIRANNEAPGSTALWTANDTINPSLRPRLRVTWQSADPTPIAEPRRGLGGDRPASPARGARPAPPARTPTLRPGIMQ